MYGRAGLERFKKAETLEPFSVTGNSVAGEASAFSVSLSQNTAPCAVSSSQQSTQIGGGQSTWQPPDWSSDPLPGVYYLEVLKDGEVVDRINLDRKRHIFGRQAPACDFVLDHQSVSRQHAAVVPHRNGSIYVIDLGSVHGTFVANERATGDVPVELEVGQSLRFAASTRTYILRKNAAAMFPPLKRTEGIVLPPPPDPSDEDAVLLYNTLLNCYSMSGRDKAERPAKRPRKRERRAVTFRDELGVELVDYMGFSDGADVGTEPGPVGVREGALVGKYESLVQVTVIPKGNNAGNTHPKGITSKLQEVLSRVRNSAGRKELDVLYPDDSCSGKITSSWACPQSGATTTHSPNPVGHAAGGVAISKVPEDDDGDDDDLFGE